MSITSEDLEHKFTELYSKATCDRSVRFRRAIAWVGRAQKERRDHSAAIIFYWIAFNALYAREQKASGAAPTEEFKISSFLRKIVDADLDCRLSTAIRTEVRKEILDLGGNQFVYSEYWDYLRGNERSKHWEQNLRKSALSLPSKVDKRNALPALKTSFKRLYTLRCQIMHGSSTWRDGDHREQVKQGSTILSCLIPIMIDISLNSPEVEFGDVPYRPINARNGEPILNAAE